MNFQYFLVNDRNMKMKVSQIKEGKAYTSRTLPLLYLPQDIWPMFYHQLFRNLSYSKQNMEQ